MAGKAGNIYMRIEKVTVEGAGFDGSEFDGGEHMTGLGTWFSISSFGFSGARNVNMTPGKAQGIVDTGMQGFSPFDITKEMDEFSEILSSRLIAPNLKGGDKKGSKTYNIGGDNYGVIVTNASTDKMRVLYMITLNGGHVVSYHLGGSAASEPFESIQLAYNTVNVKYWSWDPDNADFVPGGLVSFHLPSYTALSHYSNK